VAERHDRIGVPCELGHQPHLNAGCLHGRGKSVPGCLRGHVGHASSLLRVNKVSESTGCRDAFFTFKTAQMSPTLKASSFRVLMTRVLKRSGQVGPSDERRLVLQALAVSTIHAAAWRR
jgi:hypothetical protein